MAVSVEFFPGQELKWDMPNLVRNNNNDGAVYVASNLLATTAVLNGNWYLNVQNGPTAYIWDIEISSDTNISYTVNRVSFGVPALAAVAVSKLTSSGTGGSSNNFYSQALASLAVVSTLTQGFCGAYNPVSVLKKGWIRTGGNEGIYIISQNVVANVVCSIYFAEFSD